MKRPKAEKSLIPSLSPVARDKPSPIPQHAGDIEKRCSNCQHFEPQTPKVGECHNGISGKILSGTRSIDGCAYGFYPSIEKFPLKAGPGGAR